jgi:hypothetical protein
VSSKLFSLFKHSLKRLEHRAEVDALFTLQLVCCGRERREDDLKDQVIGVGLTATGFICSRQHLVVLKDLKQELAKNLRADEAVVNEVA